MRFNRKLIPFAFISFILLQLIAGTFIFTPQKAYAASPYDDDVNSNYNRTPGKDVFTTRTDRDNPYIRVDNKADSFPDNGDYTYKTGSAEFSTVAAPRIATFVNGDARLTMDLCFPGTFTYQKGNPKDQDQMWDIRNGGDSSTKKFYADQAEKLYSKLKSSGVWEEHQKFADKSYRDKTCASRIDISPLNQRKVSVHFKIKAGDKDYIQASAQADKLAFLKKSGNFRFRLIKLPGNNNSGAASVIKDKDGKEVTIALTINQDFEVDQDDVTWSSAAITADNYAVQMVGSSLVYNLDTNSNSQQCGGDKNKKCFHILEDDGFSPELSKLMKELDSDYQKKIEDSKGNQGDNSGGSNPSGGGNTDGTADDTNATCEASGFSLNWILCPVFNMFAETTDWLFKNLVSPLLYTSPVSTDPADPSFKAWSAFRVYGNIFLIIAMLVIVFGQTIGGGIIDAYTAKKVMPRILVAAILINLSVYIVGLLVDITNVLGKGIGQLMMAPVADLLNVAPSPGAQLGAVLTTVLALFLGSAGIAGFLGGFLTAGFLGKAAVFILIGIIVPAMLAILAVFATLVIRRGMILALIMVSPVAFALYCLPNTEQYFKKWWNLLFETLLVFPIVVVIFSTASILSATILVANDAVGSAGSPNPVTAGLAGLIAFSLQIIPLFLIPFSFKFAGGAMGKLYAAVAGGTAKVGGLTKSRKEQAKQDVQRRMLTARDRQYRALGTYASRGGRFGRSARFLQGRVGGYNLEEGITAMRGETQKRMEQLTSTGDDTEVRALTVNKAEADAIGGNLNAPDGNGHVRIHNGARQYKTLGGKWVEESAVDAAHNRWRGDQDAAQYALSYEMRKATTQEQHDYLYQNVGRLATRGGAAENATTGQMGGIWTGAAFANQNTDREWKHYQYGENGLTMNATALMQEIDERQGTYQMTQQHPDTWTTMSEEVVRARDTLGRIPAGTVVPEEIEQRAAAEEVIQRGARIARSIGQTVPEMTPGGAPTGRMITQVGGGASGRTKEEMENFYALFETSSRIDPATGHAATDPDEGSRGVGTPGRAAPIAGPPPRSTVPGGPAGRSGTPLPGEDIPIDVGNDRTKRQ